MGMFDYIRSSYDLGPEFTEVECQTKDIEDWGIGGSMSHFWLDPNGWLWCGEYAGTATFETIGEGDPRHNTTRPFLNFEWVPTGKHGRYHVHPITKYIELYPAEWDGEWEDWPRCRLHFRQGKLQDFERVTRR